MPRSESEPIRSLVKISTGKALRLDRSSGQSTPEQAPEQAGQGSGDGLVERGTVINRIKASAVDGPTDTALNVMYQ